MTTLVQALLQDDFIAQLNSDDNAATDDEEEGKKPISNDLYKDEVKNNDDEIMKAK